MIKFFRHIRKSLIEQDKMGKYFKYAIGEILLVVLGILIALQINNWNENRKNEINEIGLLEKLQEENLLNMSTLKDHIDIRREVPIAIDNFIELISSKDLELKSNQIKNELSDLLQSSAYTFIQSNLINYIKTHNSGNSELTKELAMLEFYENDLELSSTKGLDLKIKYVFEALENDIDFYSLNIHSYETLKSLKFKNNMILMSEIESEISSMFAKTYNQMKKADSLISFRLKR